MSSTSESSVPDVLDAVAERNQFLGENRCIVCGLGTMDSDFLENCYIIAPGDEQTWLDLKHRNCIPPGAKDSPQDEPRNVMLMCPTHRVCFEKEKFIIRYIPKARRFVLLKCPTAGMSLSKFHRRAIALTIDDAPYPALFQAHEMGVVQRRSFTPDISDDESSFPWQDWIVEDGVFDKASQTFRRSK